MAEILQISSSRTETSPRGEGGVFVATMKHPNVPFVINTETRQRQTAPQQSPLTLEHVREMLGERKYEERQLGEPHYPDEKVTSAEARTMLEGFEQYRETGELPENPGSTEKERAATAPPYPTPEETATMLSQEPSLSIEQNATPATHSPDTPAPVQPPAEETSPKPPEATSEPEDVSSEPKTDGRLRRFFTRRRGEQPSRRPTASPPPASPPSEGPPWARSASHLAPEAAPAAPDQPARGVAQVVTPYSEDAEPVPPQPEAESDHAEESTQLGDLPTAGRRPDGAQGVFPVSQELNVGEKEETAEQIREQLQAKIPGIPEDTLNMLVGSIQQERAMGITDDLHSEMLTPTESSAPTEVKPELETDVGTYIDELIRDTNLQWTEKAKHDGVTFFTLIANRYPILLDNPEARRAFIRREFLTYLADLQAKEAARNTTPPREGETGDETTSELSAEEQAARRAQIETFIGDQDATYEGKDLRDDVADLIRTGGGWGDIVRTLNPDLAWRADRGASTTEEQMQARNTLVRRFIATIRNREITKERYSDQQLREIFKENRWVDFFSSPTE